MDSSTTDKSKELYTCLTSTQYVWMVMLTIGLIGSILVVPILGGTAYAVNNSTFTIFAAFLSGIFVLSYSIGSAFLGWNTAFRFAKLKIYGEAPP